MHYHREASKHYEIGKDYAHAAHQALLAHGHALRAVDRAKEAGDYYAARDGRAEKPAAVSLFLEKRLEAAGASRADLSGAARHIVAAEHHEQAARHHGEASKHNDLANYALAAHDVRVAQGYAQHALFEGDEAAKHHVEHYGKSGPTAELL
jgi:hypothetical protein